jgi:hypothetical protein
MNKRYVSLRRLRSGFMLAGDELLWDYTGDVEVLPETSIGNYGATVIRVNVKPLKDVPKDYDGDECHVAAFGIFNPHLDYVNWPSMGIAGFLHELRIGKEVHVEDGDPSFVPPVDTTWVPSMVYLSILEAK